MQSTDFGRIFAIYRKLLRVKAFLDEIAEEFIDAKSVYLSCNSTGKYTLRVEYEAHEFNRLSKIDDPDSNLDRAQKQHLAKELSEILINISSHSGSRIKNCQLLDPQCFVFDTKTGWNDAKIDLFYLAVVSELDVVSVEGTDDGKSSLVQTFQTPRDQQSRFSLRSGLRRGNEPSLISDV